MWISLNGPVVVFVLSLCCSCRSSMRRRREQLRCVAAILGLGHDGVVTRSIFHREWRHARFDWSSRRGGLSEVFFFSRLSDFPLNLADMEWRRFRPPSATGTHRYRCCVVIFFSGGDVIRDDFPPPPPLFESEPHGGAVLPRYSQRWYYSVKYYLLYYTVCANNVFLTLWL